MASKAKIEACRKGGLVQGKRNAESGHMRAVGKSGVGLQIVIEQKLGILGATPEQQSEWNRQSAEAAGKEEMTRRATLGGNVSKEKQLGFLSPDYDNTEAAARGRETQKEKGLGINDPEIRARGKRARREATKRMAQEKKVGIFIPEVQLAAAFLGSHLRWHVYKRSPKPHKCALCAELRLQIRSRSKCSEAKEVDQVKEKGEVKWFDAAKGYGFIQRQSGEDILCHWTGIVADGYKSLNDGQAVEFIVADSPKGLNATQVVALD